MSKSKFRPDRTQVIGKKSSIIRNPDVQIKEGFGNDRISRIENCKECNGQPEIVSFELPEFKGFRCKKCWEIINYERK